MARAWSWVRRAIYAACGLVVLVLVLLAAAQTVLNTDAGRQRLVTTLAGILGQDLEAGSLELHLLSGLTLKNVKLTPRAELADHPFVIADELALGYSLSELAHGTLRIDRLALSGAKVDLVFRDGKSNIPMAGAAKAIEAPPESVAPKARGIALPPLPVTIQLDELRLTDLAVRVDLDGALQVSSRGLDVDLAGFVGPRGANLELGASHRDGVSNELVVSMNGERDLEVRTKLDLELDVKGKDLDRLDLGLKLGLPGAQVNLGSGSRPVTMSLAAKGLVDLSRAMLELASLSLDLGAAGEIEGAAKIEDFLVAPRLDAAIPHGTLVLEELVPIAAPFLPPLTAAGRIELENVAVNGDLAGGTEAAPFTANGRVVLANVAASMPSAHVEASDLDGAVEITRAKLVHFLPVELAALGKLTLARASLPDGGRIEDLAIELDSTAKGSDFRDVHARVALAAPRVTPPGLGPGAKPVALTAQVTTTADLSSGNLSGIHATLGIPTALDLEARGDVGAFGRGPIKGSATVSAKPGTLLAMVPATLLGDLAGAKVSGGLRIETTAEGDGKAGTLAASGRLSLDKLGASGLPSGLGLGSASGDLEFESSLGAGWKPGAAKLAGTLAFDRIAAVDAVRVQGATLTVSANADTIPPQHASVAVELSAKGASYRTKDLETPPQDLKLRARAQGDPIRGDLTLDSLDLSLDRVARLSASGRTRAFGRAELEARLRLDGIDLATLATRLPRSVGEKVSGIAATGIPTLDVTMKGRIPTPEEILALAPPLTGRLHFDLPSGSLKWPQRELSVPRVATKLDVVVEPARIAVDLDGGAWGLVDRHDLGPKSWDLVTTLHTALSDRDRLEISQGHFGVLNRGAFAFVTGEISGLAPVVSARVLPPIAEILGKLAGQVEAVTGFARPEPEEIAPGTTVTGGGSARLAVKLRPGRDVTIDGQTFFQDLSLSRPPSLEVAGLSGRFPIRKTLRIVGAGQKRAALADTELSEAASDRNRSLYGTLRPLSTNRDNVRLTKLTAGPVSAHDLYFDVEFAERALNISRFGIGTLDGWVGGNLATSFSPARNRILLETDFAELDLRKLLPLESDLGKEEAQVSGTSRVQIDLARGESGHAVSLGDMNAQVNLTRIGEKALDQILAFLDPKGANSSISTFRTILSTTDLTIDRVQLPIQNGTLTVRVEYGLHAHVPRFLEKALNVVYDTTNTFEVPAIDLLRLQNVEKLAQILEKLESVKPILDIVGGDHIQAEPDGSLRIE